MYSKVQDLNGMCTLGVHPNGNGSTITWTFIKPDGLSDEQFKEQLKNFDSEIDAWRKALERDNNSKLLN
jgi:hypothetical protein